VVPAPLPPANTASLTDGSITKPAAIAAKPATAQKAIAPRDESKPSHSPAKAITKDEHKSEHTKSSEKASGSTDSGKIYVVVKGDNPVTIAKRLKVPYDDLIALNHIEDPRKLQIGQKLLIPNKTSKAKKTGE
jgi:LysM repeat protein